MKKIILILYFILSNTIYSRAQSRNTVETIGQSIEAIYPDSYEVIFVLGEEERRSNNSAVIGKTSIDTITLDLFKKLKEYKLEKKDLNLLTITTDESSQRTSYYITLVYGTTVPDKQTVVKLVNNLRCSGLKGMQVTGLYKEPETQIMNKIQTAAITDARNKAIALAKGTNQQIGDIVSCYVSNHWYDNREDYHRKDYSSSYDLRKFNMNMKERRFIRFSVTVNFELK
jgi:uncharacterized protein YggE